MPFASAWLLAGAFLPLQKQVALASKSSEISSQAPQWIDGGEDDKRRRIWVRMQRDPQSIATILIDIFVDGHLVKSKKFPSADFLLADIPGSLIKAGDNWLLFYDVHPGAGDTWFTDYLVIRRSDFRFENQGQFEHGDFSMFQKSRRFYEYKLLKYQGDHRFWKLGLFGYRVVSWHWNERQEKFQETSHWYRSRLAGLLDKKWNDLPHVRPSDGLIGTLDYFRPLHPREYGLPIDSHFMVAPGYGFGNWTIGLVSGAPHYDDLHLIKGLKDLCGLDYSIGELDPHHAPRIAKSDRGLILILTTFEFRKVRISKFLVTTKPFKISLLSSWLEPEWTPFKK